MNERVMQFRIGMFVIVAGLVLTMLVVWFGESPSLFRGQSFVTVHYTDAPGVTEGTPVRKSGIRVGEVVAIRFDERTDKPDGVLVTIALDRKFPIRSGSVPRITRALIGDVSIDFMPGTGSGPLVTSEHEKSAPIIEGEVSPDPSNALAAATEAFQNVKGTLESIDEAAKGLSVASKRTEHLDEFLVSIRDAGQKVSTLATDLDQLVQENRGNLQPTLANLRDATARFNATFDPKTTANIQLTARQLAAATTKLDQIAADFGPLAKELGAPANAQTSPRTNLGQAMLGLNSVTYDVGLLTRNLRGKDGRLNPNGSLQKLVTQTELYDNFNQMASAARETIAHARTALKNLNQFAERVAKDPGVIGSGVLRH